MWGTLADSVVVLLGIAWFVGAVVVVLGDLLHKDDR